MILIIVEICKVGFFPLFAAKSVLKLLMKVDPAHRLTAKELLDNQWLTVSFSTTALKNILAHYHCLFLFTWPYNLYIVLKQSFSFIF